MARGEESFVTDVSAQERKRRASRDDRDEGSRLRLTAPGMEVIVKADRGRYEGRERRRWCVR
jgi:hypothetical protein